MKLGILCHFTPVLSVGPPSLAISSEAHIGESGHSAEQLLQTGPTLKLFCHQQISIFYPHN